jgi:hypothetical protein
MDVVSLKDKPKVATQLDKNKDYNFNKIRVMVHTYNRNLPVTKK